MAYFSVLLPKLASFLILIGLGQELPGWAS